MHGAAQPDTGQSLWSSPHRQGLLERVADAHFDVVVVGGGINGAASAAALSASGLRVALFERGDFSSGTSQESSNLAWGGIKYLEGGEIGLVRGLCRSRNRLLDAFPRSVLETRFLLSHEPGFRHGLRTLYAGSWLYWVLGQRHTQAPRLWSVDELREDARLVRASRFDGALEYSDACFLDGDARFVFSFVRNAWSTGAVALNYAACSSANYRDGRWQLAIQDRVSAGAIHCTASVLVNACGPWADEFAEGAGACPEHQHLFSKGVHLIVPKIEDVRRVLTFFADDGRLFFAIPFGNRTCIGTTDTRVATPDAEVSDDDRQFILDNVNARLALSEPLTMADVISERCGVRPLAVQRGGAASGDWLQLSRRHVLEVDPLLPLLSVYGGKLTDCVNIGAEVVDAVCARGHSAELPELWYGEGMCLDAPRLNQLLPQERRLPSGCSYVDYLWRRYGVDAVQYAEMTRDDPALLEPIGDGCDAIRLDWVVGKIDESVVCSEDFRRRRTQLAMCSPSAELHG